MYQTNKMVLIVEYDGRNYHGFQLQDDLPTIQGEVEGALWRLTGEKSRVTAASRTDAGVHARGQVASFRTGLSLPPRTFISGLNAYLPDDIAVKAAYRVDDSFDVRRDALSREYHYYSLNSRTRSPLGRDFVHLVRGHLDVESMNDACRALIGRHDFASFVTGDWGWLRSTVRTVYRAGVVADGETVVFSMVADSFLPHQVRNTVGTLIRVGLGRMDIDEFRGVMAVRTPSLAGPTAPACGLCLMRVDYPLAFEERTDGLVSREAIGAHSGGIRN